MGLAGDMMANAIHRSGSNLFFLCPGCKGPHRIQIEGTPAWTWNGSEEKPTFQPSIRVSERGEDGQMRTACHSFVTNGNIQFLNDSIHELAGQTVPIPDWDSKWDEP